MHAATMALPATTRPALLARVNSRCPVAVADLASVSLPRGRGSAAACDRGGVICTAVKGHSARSVCCSKTLVAKPDTIDAVVDLCQRAVAFSRSRLGRGSGVREFSCSQDAFEPHILHFFEVYDSTAAMGKHNTTRELSDFLEQVAPLLERPVGMALYETRDGKLGAVCMQSGPKGEGGLDDATGASGAAGGASYKQTSRMTEISSMVLGGKGDDEHVSEPAGQQRPQQHGVPRPSWQQGAGVVAGVVAGAALISRLLGGVSVMPLS